MKNIYCCFYTKNQFSSVVNYRSAQERGINPTIPPRQIDVDSMWTSLQYVEDQISTNFSVISTYFFDVISLSEKTTSFPRTLFDLIFMVEKSTLFRCTFFLCNFDNRKISKQYACAFFDYISVGKNSKAFCVKLHANQKIREGFAFANNFKKLAFGRLFSLNFSIKSPRCSIKF